MRPRLIAAAAAVLLLALTGCSAAAEPQSGYVVESDPEPVETLASSPAPPLVAESPAAGTDETAKTPESEYLREVRAQMEQPISQIPKDATDDQLLAAADKACELMRAGTVMSEIQLIDGETPNPSTNNLRDSGVMADAANRHLCPDVTPNYGN
ncbi:MAG: DUF732 domain-containing protein [Microbacterium sp.]|jgi:hypothetical protein|nr:DUF732 domain-containing protein [Microbacterium sp.]